MIENQMMIKGADVLMMLLPAGGWSQVGNEFEGITFEDASYSVSKEQYLSGFEIYEDTKKTEKEAKDIARKVILDRIGLTEEEAEILLQK